jgi:hypothetical protein
MDSTLDIYGKLNDRCRVRDAAIKAARTGAEDSTANAL